MPQKAGYTLASTGTLFKYSHLEDHPYVSDANNPTVIKMWKLQGAERLIHFQTEIRVPLNGVPTALDLQTGKQVESGGDIIISVKSSPVPSIREEYDWQISIQAVDGGLISCSDDFEQMFQAPDSGYESKFDINYQKGIQSWTSRFIDNFYFASRNMSFYGKLGIEVISDGVKNGTVPVILNSYINVTGSKNLEIDPQLITNAHP